MFSILNRPLRVIALPVIVALAACDNPVSDNHDHLDDVESVEITDLSGEMVAELHGDHWHFGSGGDALHLHPGDELEVRIFFVAADGDRFQLPVSGEEHTLRVEIANPAVVEYEDHGDHGHFLALSAGETTATIQIYHGSHADWQTNPPMPVEVVDHGAH